MGQNLPSTADTERGWYEHLFVLTHPAGPRTRPP